MEWLIGHLVGDYLLQNDWMALNKKKSTVHCVVHVLLYCTAVYAFTGWPLWAMAVTFACHFIQDRTSIVRWYMSRVGQDQFASGPCAPWSMIVVDNTLHLVQLYLLAALV